MSKEVHEKFIADDKKVDQPDFLSVKTSHSKEVVHKEKLRQVYSGIVVDGDNKKSNSFQIGIGGKAIVSKKINAGKKATIVVSVEIE